MNKWVLRHAVIDPQIIMDANPQIPKIIAQILAVRGYKDSQEINAFLYAEDAVLPSPFLFKDMDKAVDLIMKAIEQEKKVVIFGDYDVDGIMSTFILYRTLASLGGNIDFYIPQRETEGYGLNLEAISQLHDQGAQIILACDTGISAIEQIEFANSLGIQVVVLDHHDVLCNELNKKGILPAAAAIVDPKQADCPYPFKQYCAAGICYRFSQAIYERSLLDWWSLGQELLPFAAIATVCDLMDIKGDNRYLVKTGLPLINKSANFGLRALLKLNNLQDKTISVYHVGFIIGPCINASGRLEMASLAVELFLAEDVNNADNLASHLLQLNTSRKNITNDGTAMAINIVKERGLQGNKVIVLHCPQIHESVAGIIAGKVKECFYRPTIILTGDDDILRGSCRSIEGYNIFQALCSCRDFLLNFGGHPMAAGLSIKRQYLPLLEQKLNNECLLDLADMVPTIRIDKHLPLHFTNKDLARMLSLLEPYGKGNTTPYFADKNVSVSKINIIGKDANVVKFVCHTSGRNNTSELILFNGKDRLQELITTYFGEEKWQGLLRGNTNGIRLDFVYTMGINTYNGKENLQLQIIDFRIGEENQ